MKRQELQNLINDYRLYDCHSERLGSCNAKVWYTDHGKILQSYSTRVAYLDDDSSTLYVLGYWSATTCQHVSKFIKQQNPGEIVYLYDRSDNTPVKRGWANPMEFRKHFSNRVRKSEMRELIENDFEALIDESDFITDCEVLI